MINLFFTDQQSEDESRDEVNTFLFQFSTKMNKDFIVYNIL